MRKYILLTGATGLLGQYLMRDLLLGGHRLAVLVRPNKKQTADERIEQSMQMWERELEKTLPRPVVLTGNITEENVGLSAEDSAWVKENVTTMLHCAASLTFHEHKGEPWLTNVEGTRKILKLCEDNDIHDMHYISTAYVCGNRHDLVMEDELDVNQEFRNDYEKSKFDAEQLVRQCKAFPPEHLTVYRPVVITGDSITGYTSTYHGTYLYMKLASVLTTHVEPNEKGEHHIPVRWGLKGNERRNITAVDWNSTVIYRIFNNPEAHGRTFHLGPSDPITMRDAINYASKFYGLTGIEFRGFGRNPDVPMNETERWLWSNISIYGSYDFMDPRFDTTNLNRFVPDVECPKLDWEMAKRLMEYAEKDRWGKRKPTPPKAAPADVAAHLKHLRDLAGNNSSDEVVHVGLNVTGPGGGQWDLHLVGDHIVDFERGLPEPDQNCWSLELDCETLSKMIGQGSAAAKTIEPHLQNADSAELAQQLALALFAEATPT